MPSSKPKKTSGPDSSQFIFALIAIGVAMAILASPIANAITSARRAAASVNLNEIAKAYDAYVQANTSTHMLSVQPGATAQAAAVTLARVEQLNDAIIWFVKSDPKLNGESVPTTVTSVGLTANSNSINPDFANKTLSYDIAANINLSPPAPIPQPNPASTPIAWTRGLRDDGTWGPDSPWHGAGGHIAFLDGHVTWFDKLSTQPGSELLYKYGTNTPTTNINEALPPGTIILNAEPGPAGP
jgi:prepilin-type processing-associated H-X9-DG protein